METKYLNQSLFSYEILKDNYFLGVGTTNYFSACSDLKNTPKKDVIQVNAVHCYTHPHQFYYELK